MGTKVVQVALLAVLLAVVGACRASAAPPVVEATWVTNVTSSSATLRSQVDPNGLPTTYRFEYVTQAAWEANGFSAAVLAPVSGAAPLGSGTEPIAVAQSIFSLNPTTTYRYRVRATNGTVQLGPERSLTTEVASNAFSLPDQRAWELVSPGDKGGGAILGPETLFGGGVFQAAAGGDSITYSSAFSFAGGEGAPGAGQYVSTRSPGGWSTTNITTPAVSGSYGDDPDGVPYRVFAADLSGGLLSNGLRCRSVGTHCPVANPPLPGSGAPAGLRNYYLRTAGGFQALLTAADAPALALAPEEFELALAGATPDLAHIVLSTCAKLTADAAEVPASEGCDEDEQNLYEWSGGALRLLNLRPGQSVGTPGAALASTAGAISDDGSRVYFSVPEGGSLYLSEEGGTLLLPETNGGGASFQFASSNGLIAYFTKGANLYRYDATADSSTPVAGGVTGVLGASSDGSYVYFQTAAGLQRWHGGTTDQIAPGASASAPGSFPPATGTARVSADGTRLAFLSAAELTGYENVDAEDGSRDTEAYIYREPPGGGPGTLLCASCNPTGERPTGSASIPGAQANGTTLLYRPRVLSLDGNRLFFDSSDRLAVADTDHLPDVYEWEAPGTGDCARAPGCVRLISEARSTGASFVDASADGEDVFFLTGESSVASDPGSADIYDARVDGGLPEPVGPLDCVGDACQPLPSPPEDQGAGTQLLNAGNPSLKIVKPKPHKHRKHKHRKRRRHHRKADR